MLKIHIVIFLLLTAFCFGQNARFAHESYVTQKDNYSFSRLNFNVPSFDRKQKKDSVSFEGSLIIPKDGFDKVVIIKPGTGNNTRNTHSYLAEALLDNHVAVFRYDERGIGNSKGNGGGDMLYTPTMMGAELSCAFKMLKKHPALKDKKMGIIGHSLGGIAIMNALEHKIEPDFLVFLSTPVVDGKQMFLYQLQNHENGFNDYFLYDTLEEKEKICSDLVDFYKANKNDKKFLKIFRKELKRLGYTQKRIGTRFPFLIAPVEKELALKESSNFLNNIKIPLFYMIGTEDVLVDPKENTRLLKRIDNPIISIIVLEGENHFFSDEEGAPYEIHELPKQKIVNWIVKQ